MAFALPRIIHKDPATPSGIVLPRGIFDNRPHRNRDMPYIKRFPGIGRAAIVDEHGVRKVEDMPSTERMIATVVEWGMPLWAADQARYSPYRLYDLWTAYAVVTLAGEGDVDAKQRLDLMRGKWEEMRRVELISDQPEKTIGLWER